MEYHKKIFFLSFLLPIPVVPPNSGNNNSILPAAWYKHWYHLWVLFLSYPTSSPSGYPVGCPLRTYPEYDLFTPPVPRSALISYLPAAASWLASCFHHRPDSNQTDPTSSQNIPVSSFCQSRSYDPCSDPWASMFSDLIPSSVPSNSLSTPASLEASFTLFLESPRAFALAVPPPASHVAHSVLQVLAHMSPSLWGLLTPPTSFPACSILTTLSFLALFHSLCSIFHF